MGVIKTYHFMSEVQGEIDRVLAAEGRVIDDDALTRVYEACFRPHVDQVVGDDVLRGLLMALSHEKIDDCAVDPTDPAAMFTRIDRAKATQDLPGVRFTFDDPDDPDDEPVT